MTGGFTLASLYFRLDAANMHFRGKDTISHPFSSLSRQEIVPLYDYHQWWVQTSIIDSVAAIN